jgi:hypothetical protein
LFFSHQIEENINSWLDYLREALKSQDHDALGRFPLFAASSRTLNLFLKPASYSPLSVYTIQRGIRYDSTGSAHLILDIPFAAPIQAIGNSEDG